MSERTLTVGGRVIKEMVRLAALEVPGVVRIGRAGPLWRRALLGRSVMTRVRDGRVTVRLSLVARPGHPIEPLVEQVRLAICATVERLLGLELEAVTVVVDGVGS